MTLFTVRNGLRARGTGLRWLAAGISLLVVAPLTVPAATAVVGAPSGDEYAFAARLDSGDGERACSGALVFPAWVVAAKSCFTDVPGTSVPAGPPGDVTTATIGRADLTSTIGQVRQVVELLPHENRDLVLARLDRVVTGIQPLAIGATAPAPGDELVLPGFGRTAAEWSPLRRHAGRFVVESVTGGDLVLTGQDGAAICAGDTGGPALRETAGGGFELVAVNSRSWQGGCFGTDATETRTGAVDVRTDDIADWVALGPVMETWTDLVKAVYRDSLGRDATSDEVQAWADNFEGPAGDGVAAIDRAPGLAGAMESSPKYKEARVIEAFESTLEYTPSAEQVENHLAQVADGTRTLDEVELFLLYHESYYAHVGGTNTAYLNALYQHILHRAPTAEQTAYWIPRLQADRRAAVRELWDNPSSVRTRITDAYQHYLGRSATVSERDHWQAQLGELEGRSEAAMRRGILSSPEYLERAGTRY